MSYTKLHTSEPLSFLEAEELEEPRYVVLGVPYDGTSTFRPGSKFAPNAIREASANIETYSLRAGLDGSNLKIRDLGNLDVAQDVRETLRRLRLVVSEQLSKGLKVLLLGGEHTITLGTVEAFGEARDLGVLCFDAHMDFRDEYLGAKISHATVIRRICERIGADKVLIVGVRAFSKEELEYARKVRLKFLTSLDLFKNWKEAVGEVKQWVKRFKKVYISVDMDVLDPSQAPGVANPEPEGLTTTQLLDVLWEVCSSNVAAVDLVEVSHIYDSGLTAIQTAKIALEILCFIETRSR